MKRLLMGAGALALVLLGANYYYEYQVKKHLATAAQMMRTMGGYLEYADVSVTLGGDVEIDRVRVMPPGVGESINLKKIALRTNGVFGIHSLAMDMRKKRLPAQLSLSFEGAVVPVGGDAYRQMNTMAQESSEHLLTAGCGQRTQFSDSDIAAMGFGELVTVDTEIEYRLMNEGQWLEFENKATIDGMNELNMKMDFTLDAKSRDFSALSAAMVNTRFNELVVTYRDKGYVKQALEFCQKEAAMARQEFLAHHLESWQTALKNLGFSAGPNTVAAYAKFVEDPQELRFSIKPIGDFTFEKLPEMTPDLLPYQFRTQLAVNGAQVGDLDIAAAPKEPAEMVLASADTGATVAARASSTGTSPKGRNNEKKAVAVDELRNHLNAEVVLHLHNGRTLNGRIIQFTDGGLQLHSYQPTGFMTIPVNFTQIKEAFLR